MQTAAVWAAVVLIQSSRLLVSAIRPRSADAISTQPVVIDGFVDKREGIVEPSCEELRAMWRYTKRQSRKADAATDYPIYTDSMPYNMWNVYPERPRSPYTYRIPVNYAARQRTRGPPIYGRLVHKAPASSRFRNGMPHRGRTFEDVAHLYGTVNHQPPSSRRRLTSFRTGGSSPMYQVPQAGKFQHLKELIRTERARELQEQHADEIARAIKEVTPEDELEETHKPRKQFLNTLQTYHIPGKSFDRNFEYENHYLSNVADATRAWTRNGGYPREYSG